MHQANESPTEFYQVREEFSESEPPRMVLDVADLYRDGTFQTFWNVVAQSHPGSALPAVATRVICGGTPKDFNWPIEPLMIVSPELGEYLCAAGPTDICTGPVTSDDDTNWVSLHVARMIDCIDHANSRLQYRPPHHPNAFSIYGVLHLVLDENRIPEEASIFRLTEWPSFVVVRDNVAESLRSKRFTGLQLQKVSTVAAVHNSRIQAAIRRANTEARNAAFHTICPLCYDPVLSSDPTTSIPPWFQAACRNEFPAILHRQCFEHWLQKTNRIP